MNQVYESMCRVSKLPSEFIKVDNDVKDCGGHKFKITKRSHMHVLINFFSLIDVYRNLFN